MVIAGLDQATTTKMQLAEDRSSKRRKYYASVASDEGCSTVSFISDISDTDGETRPEPIEDIGGKPNFDTETAEQLSEQDDEYKMSSNSNLSESCAKKTMTKFPTVARECDRYGVSNAAGAICYVASVYC